MGFSEIFSEVADTHNSNIITNVTPLNYKNIVLLLCKKNFRVVEVSIDGDMKLMNSLQGMKPRVFEKMIDYLKYFV